MEFIIIQIIIPLAIGVLTSFIAKWLKEELKGKSVFIIGMIVALIVAIGFLFWLPPYKVMSVNWCLKTNGSLQVKGRLATLILGEPVPDRTIQIKVFKVGEEAAFKDAKSADTGVDGTFVVEFPPPGPTSGSNYMINTAYNYDPFLQEEKWKISNFRRGEPSPCR